MGGAYPSRLPPRVTQRLRELTQQVLDALRDAGEAGYHGCFHFEAKVSADLTRVMPLELNCRVGGAECPAANEASSGWWLPGVATCLALDRVPTRALPSHPVVVSMNLHLLPSCSGVVTQLSSRGLQVEALNVVECTLELQKIGQAFTGSNGSQRCLGWVVCGGQSVGEASQRLREAVSQLVIRVDDKAAQVGVSACGDSGGGGSGSGNSNGGGNDSDSYSSGGGSDSGSSDVIVVV